MAEAGLAHERSVFRAIAHVEASEEVLVFRRVGVAVFVGLEVLQISLDHGMHVAHLGQEEMLSLDNAVDDVIEGSRGCRR